MNSLGIDIGGTSVKLALRVDGKTKWTGQSAFYSRPTTEQLVEALKDAAKGRLTHAQVCGLCVPGLLDKPRRMITLSVNVPGLMNIKLDELIERAFAKRVAKVELINDAVAGATDIYESLDQSGRMVSLALGTGVGAAVLDDGEPLFVDGASPGHIGQCDVSIESQPVIGPDGGAGSLEGYIGGPALVARYGSTEAFLKQASTSEPAIRALARAIRICHAIYRPHHVVLLGGIGIRLSRLVADIKVLVDANLTSIARKDWTLRCGEHDFHAATGAARLAEPS
jgi:predicted NBD/HSP70 family sugar kinase